jgi:hypothetical protein
MASVMQQIVRPKLARPVATWREDMITMGVAFWPITAMFFDGRNHNNHTGQESFFTLTHCILYLGLTVLGGWIGVLVSRYHQRTGMIPLGYGVAVIGLCVLAVGGPADLAWHTRYGFEINVDAIYSPPHLMLFFGGLLVSSTGIRSTWARWGDAPGWRAFAPALLSGILFIGVAGFITMYLSAFMTDVAPTSAFMHDLTRFNDVRSDQSIGLNAGLTGYGDDRWPYYFYSASHGMAAEIVTTLVLLGPTLLMLRRWRVPFGAVSVIFLGFGLLVSILTEYRDAALIIPLVLAGATVDLAQRRLASGPKERVTLGGIRLIGPLAAAVLWLSYYGVLALDKGIGWGGSLMVGALIMGTLTGFGVAFLIAPPPYGPATGAVAPTADSLRA